MFSTRIFRWVLLRLIIDYLFIYFLFFIEFDILCAKTFPGNANNANWSFAWDERGLVESIYSRFAKFSDVIALVIWTNTDSRYRFLNSLSHVLY